MTFLLPHPLRYLPLLALVGSLSACDLLDNLPVGKGYTAKQLCSFVFTSGLDEDLVRDQFIAPKVEPLPWFWDVRVDHNRQQVYTGDRIFGSKVGGATAVYRPGLGCTLLVDQTAAAVKAIPFTPVPPPTLSPRQPWPLGSGAAERNRPGIDYGQLDTAIASAFTESEVEPVQTTSVVVAYQGHLLAERYAYGVTAATPMPGWSMSKSVTATLAGILIGDGKLQLDAPAPVPGWDGSDKEAITLRQLLHMSSGLQVNEDYGGISDVTRMLYTVSDQFAYAGSRPVVTTPGTRFRYSTVETARLAAALQASLGGSLQDVYDFYQQRLFHPLGIRSGFFEVDASGHFVAGAYAFMSSRDWARLGQLYLQRGHWQGQQIVPERWVDFVRTPSPLASDYGGHFWLNTEGNRWPEVPYDTYAMLGHQGQRVVIIPSRQLVVVRTGITETEALQNRVMNRLLNGILTAVPPPEQMDDGAPMVEISPHKVDDEATSDTRKPT